MTEPRVFFQHTVEAMFVVAFPPAASPALLERYRSAGLDLSKPLLPAYDAAVWRACLEAQREVLLGDRPPGEGAREQGARYVAAYFARTVIGGALLVLLRVIGPKRALERMTRNFRSANNFSSVRFEATGPRSARLHLNDVFSDSPLFIVGMLEHGLSLMGTRATVTPRGMDGDDFVFDAEWQ